MAADPIDAYLAAQPLPQRATLLAVRSTLRRVLPAATECMTYAMPTFQVDGTSVVSYAGFVRHCSLFPHSGIALDGIASHLDGYDIDKGTLRFPIDRPLPIGVVRLVVAAKLQAITDSDAAKGFAREFYDNGALKLKGMLRNGAMHGAWSFYRKDGSLMRSGSFRTGEQTGSWRTFDRSGALVKETQFVASKQP
ncbi:MAG: hypothetical protein Q8M22_14445 [Actinomycetota bacterium]|nr:hypothetical protein [Actinomycetota bacterium]